MRIYMIYQIEPEWAFCGVSESPEEAEAKCKELKEMYPENEYEWVG